VKLDDLLAGTSSQSSSDVVGHSATALSSEGTAGIITSLSHNQSIHRTHTSGRQQVWARSQERDAKGGKLASLGGMWFVVSPVAST